MQLDVGEPPTEMRASIDARLVELSELVELWRSSSAVMVEWGPKSDEGKQKHILVSSLFKYNGNFRSYVRDCPNL